MRQYHVLMEKVLKSGVEKRDRTGTLWVFGHRTQLRIFTRRRLLIGCLFALLFAGGIISAFAADQSDPIAVPIWSDENWKQRVSAPLFATAKHVRLFASKGIIRISDNGVVSAGFSDAPESLPPGSGTDLTAHEVEKLRDSVWYTTRPNLYIACYSPRHAFVFYDDAGKYLGYLRVCYQCVGADIAPSEAPSAEKHYVMWDEGAIAQLIEAHQFSIRPQDEK